MAYDSCVLDIETLGTHSDSVVLSVGMIIVDSNEDYEFQELIDDGLYVKLSVKSQIADGRKIYKDTLDWWEKQGDSARSVLDPKSDDVPYKELINVLRDYITSHGANLNTIKMYARGSHFDFGILHDLMLRTGKEPSTPWKFWNIHDSKTVQITLVDKKIDVQPEGFIYHNALHDAAREYLNIQTAIYMFQETLDND